MKKKNFYKLSPCHCIMAYAWLDGDDYVKKKVIF